QASPGWAGGWGPLRPEERVLAAVDGTFLHAWYVAPRDGAVIVLAHGYKADHREMIPAAVMLARHGYGALLLDLRTHGASDGDVITFGARETQDVDAAVAFL